MKKVHIVVQDGLIQEVYIDKPLDVEVIIYDLDTTDPIEYAEVKYDVDRMRGCQVNINKIY